MKQPCGVGEVFKDVDALVDEFGAGREGKTPGRLLGDDDFAAPRGFGDAGGAVERGTVEIAGPFFRVAGVDAYADAELADFAPRFALKTALDGERSRERLAIDEDGQDAVTRMFDDSAAVGGHRFGEESVVASQGGRHRVAVGLP